MTNLPLHIARRYLFSKKSHNAINIISLISVLGVATATLAMVCVLSAFNGFQDLIGSYYRNFDPEMKITAVQGKTFRTDTEAFCRLRGLPSVALCCESVEDFALARYKDSQTSVRVKGVSANFDSLTHLSDCMVAGHYALEEYGLLFSVTGVGVAATLNTGSSFIDPITLYAPRRHGSVSLANPAASFRTRRILMAGTFSIGQPEYDEQYVVVPIDFARQFFEYDSTEVTSLELKLATGVRPQTAKKQIRELLGPGFRVEDLREQKAEFYRINKMEKLVTYLILSFILLVALFNVVGSLSMLILEKKQDAATLSCLGADHDTLRRVFLYEGWLIAFAGALAGLVLGILLVWLQQGTGLLKLGSGEFIVSAYPVRLRAADLGLILITVLAVSLPSVWWPIHYVFGKKEAQ